MGKSFFLGFDGSSNDALNPGAKISMTASNALCTLLQLFRESHGHLTFFGLHAWNGRILRTSRHVSSKEKFAGFTP